MPEIVGGRGIEGGTPEGTFDVGECVWVFAAGSWFDNGVAFKVDVEAEAAVDGGALFRAPVHVVAGFAVIDDRVAEVGVGAVGSRGVLEVVEVAGWGRCCEGDGRDGVVRLESTGIVYIDVVEVGNGGLRVTSISNDQASLVVARGVFAS